MLPLRDSRQGLPGGVEDNGGSGCPAESGVMEKKSHLRYLPDFPPSSLFCSVSAFCWMNIARRLRIQELGNVVLCLLPRKNVNMGIWGYQIKDSVPLFVYLFIYQKYISFYFFAVTLQNTFFISED